MRNCDKKSTTYHDDKVCEESARRKYYCQHSNNHFLSFEKSQVTRKHVKDSAEIGIASQLLNWKNLLQYYYVQLNAGIRSNKAQQMKR